MLQSKLINEKKNISLHQEIERIPMSYPYVAFTQWDKILRKEKLFLIPINYFL
jgi:hypothetical protein